MLDRALQLPQDRAGIDWAIMMPQESPALHYNEKCVSTEPQILKHEREPAGSLEESILLLSIALTDTFDCGWRSLALKGPDVGGDCDRFNVFKVLIPGSRSAQIRNCWIAR
jgi:hypothetical protein